MLARKTSAVVEAMRPHQWVKNVFVFAAPFFGKELTHLPTALHAIEAFAAFCLASSAVYVLNDLADVERDRLHPVKRDRPFASGRLSTTAGGVLCAVLIAGAVVLCLLMQNVWAAVVLAIYVAANLLYSTMLKQVVILDVMFIAAGFLLRVLMGAYATAVRPSHWLLLCTLTLSLFLGFTKRRAELVTLGKNGSEQRQVLQHYNVAFLDQMIAVVTGATVVCYIMYAVDERTMEMFGTRYLLGTVPFVLYGIFRYLYLNHNFNEGENPSKTIIRDRPFQINLVLWGLVWLFVMYLGPKMSGWMPWNQ
jgi:4-hydroxybenzoate polyprenyltransferase